MKPVLTALITLVLAGALPASARDDIKVMTQNQYLGADFASLLAPPDGDFNAELVRILQQIAATDFPARAQRQALEIARRKPDLVGLQEVWVLDCIDQDPSDDRGCEDPSIAGAFVDYLDETLDALQARGADYAAVAVVENLDLSSIQIGALPPGLPFVINGALATLIAVDRDVIVARSDIPAVAADVECANPSEDGCNYEFVLIVDVPTPLGNIEVSFERGFVVVDAEVGHRSYRFVNTHFEIREPVPRQFQCAQAAELIATLDATTPPSSTVIVVGDLNSSPVDEPVEGTLPVPEPCSEGMVVPPYMQLTGAGYTDIWALRRGPDPGFTCCQDRDLFNRRSALDERIDLIFSSEPPARVKNARVVGDRTADKTPPPDPRLWPSDHGGIVASLQFKRTPAAW